MKKKKLIPSVKNKAAQELGRLGGLARAKKLTRKQRSDIARAAVNARWNKHERTS
jgi:hypothetical protein